MQWRLNWSLRGGTRSCDPPVHKTITFIVEAISMRHGGQHTHAADTQGASRPGAQHSLACLASPCPVLGPYSGSPLPSNSLNTFMWTPFFKPYSIRGPENLWKKFPAGSKVGSSYPSHFTLKSTLPPPPRAPKSFLKYIRPGPLQGPWTSVCGRTTLWGFLCTCRGYTTLGHLGAPP